MIHEQRHTKKKLSNALLIMDHYSALFKNTRGCFDRSKSTSRSHCPLYLAKRSTQLTRATWTICCSEAALTTEISTDTSSDKKHQEITTFPPLPTTCPRPSLQQQLRTSTGLSHPKTGLTCDQSPSSIAGYNTALHPPEEPAPMPPYCPFLNLCGY